MMFRAIFGSFKLNPNKTARWSFTFDQLLRTETSRKVKNENSKFSQPYLCIFALAFSFPFQVIGLFGFIPNR